MHKLPPLPYDANALEPHIDEQTMKIHHDKHHQGYTDKFNSAIEGTKWADEKPEEVLKNIDELDEKIKQAVINNGGGYVNHSLFWEIMSPNGGGSPTGELADAINSTFSDFENFKNKFTDTAAGQFGSGWGWLVLSKGKLKIYSTPNQNSPYMNSDIPILGVDVWEHAYYLKYQNKRADYIQEWWNVVDWDKVAKRYTSAL